MSEQSIAVCVSGFGTNLRALERATRQGWLGARICLVLADRPCAALDFAEAAGIRTRLVEPSGYGDRDDWDAAVAEALMESGAELVVLAGFLRVLGAATVERFRGRILNVHPSLLPAFPGLHAIRDALAAGVRVTGVTVHFVDETLDGGPILLQEVVAVVPGEDEAALTERIHALEHRLLPRAVALMLAGPAADPPARPRALLSVSDKRGIVDLGRGLDALGYEVVSTGGTARALREAGLPVTDVAAVTGVPEMLEGRVKTLHPRIAAGVLADTRRPEHRAQLAAAGIEPFSLVVVNLYPFAKVAERQGITPDELVEEIDIGGPTLMRAAAKNHACVGVVTSPDRYGSVLGELRPEGALSDATRRSLAVEAFRHTAQYDALIAAELPRHLGFDGPAPVDEDLFPERRTLELARTQSLRYGENPHQRAALYRFSSASLGDGPSALGAAPLQGKPLSYNNLLDAAAAAGMARDLRGPGCVIVKHTNPCGVAEAEDAAVAWERALAGDPVSAFGGVVAFTTTLERHVAQRVAEVFLEVLIAPGYASGALDVLAGKPNLRVLVDASIAAGPPSAPLIEYRSCGGALLATEADVLLDDPAGWSVVTRRTPSSDERADLDLGWRVARHVKSNAIVLVRRGAVVGVGAGQMSRVDSARLAVAKAGERTAGAACASDAFYPFADALEVCAAAGVTAFIQPGGSLRDAEVISAADAADAAMLFTGVRHFRH